jgi:hypothetical protein
MISEDDLKEVINRLTGDQKLCEQDINQLIKNVSHEWHTDN